MDISRLSPSAQRQILDKLGRQQKQTKFRNTPTKRGKITFDSKREAERYDELLLLLKAGRIRDLRLQADFTLQEAYTTPEGDRVRAIRYAADFTYERQSAPDSNGDVHWIRVVEDVKSRATKTKTYEIKRKLMQERFGISISEVIDK